MMLPSCRRRSLSRVRARGAHTVVLAAALLVWGCDRPLPTETGDPNASLLGGLTQSGKTVLVGFHQAPGAAELALITGGGGTVLHRYRYIPVVSARVSLDLEALLRADPRVAYVENNLLLHPLGGKQIVDYGVSKVNAPAAWSLGYRGQGIRVGIFDSGIDVDHPDLVVTGGIDLVGDGRGLDDCQGHGTHVAGIVGARDNGHSTVGVAPRAELYSMRLADCTWGGATLAKMIQGIEWAIDNGMHVVNMSFGFGIEGVALPVPPDVPSMAAEAVFDEAYRRGVLLVAASGNSSTPYVSYPAAYASVIAVGATDENDALAVFSQWGTGQELTAPGVNNLSSYMVGQGQSTSLAVTTDGGRELEAIALAFAGKTRKQGLTTDAIYAGLGTLLDYAGVTCTGKTAVVMRGGTSFAEKAEAAMNAGCAAVVIHNHTPGNFNGTLGTATTTDGRSWIPVVSISLEEGLYLKDQIESQPTRTTLLNIDGNLAIFSGTSMASPNAAGVAALILSRNPNLTPDQVRAVLRASADDIGVSGWDPQFGFGRVNALRAVQATP